MFLQLIGAALLLQRDDFFLYPACLPALRGEGKDEIYHFCWELMGSQIKCSAEALGLNTGAPPHPPGLRSKTPSGCL